MARPKALVVGAGPGLGIALVAGETDTRALLADFVSQAA